MKKRIYYYFLCLSLPCILVLATALSLMFHNAGRKQELSAIRGHARLVYDLLGSGITGELLFSDYISYATDAPRMTIISPNGIVLLDSRTIADRLDNHIDRPEISDAFENGSGEALRYSETFKATMYYYALRLPDGNVLRVSAIIGGVADVVAVVLPAVFIATVLILLIANIAARRLTNRIIAPLENIDFDSVNPAVYDELTPYVKRINRQKEEIDEQIATISERANTIETIISQMSEGLILTDPLGIVLTANDRARELFKYDMDNANLLHIYREREFQDALRRCLRGESIMTQLEHTIVSNSGKDTKTTRSYSVYMSPVVSEEAVRGSVILFHDITENLIAERHRREFSANVSHELKTPLTTISALSEMIANGIAKDEDIESFALKINEQAGRLLVLIEDIIRLSEFDEGSSNVQETRFSLWDLAETVIASIRDNSNGIDIRLTGDRFEITAFHRMIDELLSNLIDNGVKYNKEGGSVIVDLRQSEGGEFSISVSDDGIGIPEEHQARIFERFYRVDGSRYKKTGGTGLGLSIVKHIVEFHYGSILLKSSENEGTTVTCYLKELI